MSPSDLIAKSKFDGNYLFWFIRHDLSEASAAGKERCVGLYDYEPDRLPINQGDEEANWNSKNKGHWLDLCFA